MAPHQQFFEVFKKVEFLHDHEELGIDNSTVMFSERSPVRRRNNFSNLTPFKIIDFLTSLIWPKLLYLGNPEDLRGGVGDIFARKVIQIPNLETVFESVQIWNF